MTIREEEREREARESTYVGRYEAKGLPVPGRDDEVQDGWCDICGEVCQGTRCKDHPKHS
jgi:hypothetical protein